MRYGFFVKGFVRAIEKSTRYHCMQISPTRSAFRLDFSCSQKDVGCYDTPELQNVRRKLLGLEIGGVASLEVRSHHKDGKKKA